MTSPALRILFFGTPEIAVPTLESLLAGPHDIVAVVSQPDRPRGRGRKASPSPVAAVALREDLPLIQPESVADAATVERLRAFNADLGVVVAFGQFLPKKIREMPRRGYLINAHASLLPKYRGASPIARAILEGETETGISVMRVDREMDAGPVALVRRLAIESQENTAELSDRLGELASEAIGLAVELVARDEIEWTEQDSSRATIAPKFEKSDAILDLREKAAPLARRAHALSPRPGGALTLCSDQDENFGKVGIKVTRATVLPFEPATESTVNLSRPAIGTIDRHYPDVALRIATAEGWLIPLVIQRAGGKALPVEAFLRGFAMPEDTRCELSPHTNETAP
ncbi:MAG: methionyl-tRNA formyltransferase [Myxococcota bacterium]